MVDIDPQISETLTILQEECAEVIQTISKVFRFGFSDCYPDNGAPNNVKLECEIGDTLAMIDILIEKGVVNSLSVNEAKLAKRQKLKIWSNIKDGI